MAPPSSLEIVTRDHLIAARCPALERYARLLDLLNNADVIFLELADVEVRSLHSPSDATESAGTLLLRKDQILFASPVEAADEGTQQGPEGYRRDHVEKRVFPAVVFVPPFSIRGNVHLPKAAEEQYAIPILLKGFLAMTGARAVCERNAFAREREFLAVNGQLAEMISYAPAQPQSNPAA
jgi:hypothetical protein